jgi:uncharacterized membrane protein (UPF0127 family)
MKRLYVEIADDEQKRSEGLMFRERLASDHGMLFVFGSHMPMSFWMKNTPLPLEIAFLDDDFKIVEIKEMVPNSTRSVRSSGRHKYALEVNHGWFEENGIGVGSKLKTARRISFEEDIPPGQTPPQGIDIPAPGMEGVPEQQPPHQPPQDVAVVLSFKDAIRMAETNNLAIAFEYTFNEGGGGSYFMLPQEGFDIVPGKDGNELVRGICRHSNGEPRNFIIDNVVKFDMYYDDHGKWTRLESPAPSIMKEEMPLVAAKSSPAVKISEQDLIMTKESQSYSTSGQLMMTEYWDDIKKRKGKGKTEGQAILDYLAENSKRNSPKKRKSRKKKKKK